MTSSWRETLSFRRCLRRVAKSAELYLAGMHINNGMMKGKCNLQRKPFTDPSVDKLFDFYADAAISLTNRIKVMNLTLMLQIWSLLRSLETMTDTTNRKIWRYCQKQTMLDRRSQTRDLHDEYPRAHTISDNFYPRYLMYMRRRKQALSIRLRHNHLSKSLEEGRTRSYYPCWFQRSQCFCCSWWHRLASGLTSQSHHCRSQSSQWNLLIWTTGVSWYGTVLIVCEMNMAARTILFAVICHIWRSWSYICSQSFYNHLYFIVRHKSSDLGTLLLLNNALRKDCTYKPQPLNNWYHRSRVFTCAGHAEKSLGSAYIV